MQKRRHLRQGATATHLTQGIFLLMLCQGDPMGEVVFGVESWCNQYGLLVCGLSII